jgi:tetratricopeptide (TPR) repeat protein
MDNTQQPDPELVAILKTQFDAPNWEAFEKLTPEQQVNYILLNKETLLNIKKAVDKGEAPPPTMFEVETFTRLSKSRIWHLMSKYFDNMGVDSWSTYKVPFFITCNSFIGKTYANLLSAYVNDLYLTKQLDTNEKLYIVELGTGSGKFSFHFLQALTELTTRNSLLSKVCYVMADFTDNNVKFWRENRALKKFVDLGILDFAVFNNYTDDSITLASGVKLEKGSLKNPVCVVANYMFDTMAVDLFRYHQGKVLEGTMALRSKQNEIDIDNPDIFNRMINIYKYDETPVDYYLNLNDSSYEHANCSVLYDDILRWYRDYFTTKSPTLPSTILFPVTMLNCLDRIAQWSNHRMVLLSADKGLSDPNIFINSGDPFIAVHGSISLMANYHATGLWFTQHGGVHYHNPQHDGGIRISCFISTGPASESCLDQNVSEVNTERSKKWPIFTNTYNNNVISFGPTDFYTLHKALTSTAQITIPLDAAVNCLKEAYNGTPIETTSKKLLESARQIDVETIIALLKLSCNDTDTYFNFKEIVAEKVATMHPFIKQDLFNTLISLSDNYYPLNKDRDLPFELGRIFYKTKDYTKAIDCYKVSAKYNTAIHDVIYFNIAVCYKDIGDKKKALKFANKSIEANPEYERTKVLLQLLQAESESDSIVDKIKMD